MSTDTRVVGYPTSERTSVPGKSNKTIGLLGVIPGGHVFGEFLRQSNENGDVVRSFSRVPLPLCTKNETKTVVGVTSPHLVTM